MPKATTSLDTPLREQLDRLAAFEPKGIPVISLYLDMQADEHGHTQFDQFLRKVFPERARTLKGDARRSFEADVERIHTFLANGVARSANGLAIFACHGANLFDTVQMNAPIDDHWLFIGSVPHLYPLARVNDQYPRYAALLVDTNAARLFVFSLADTEARRDIRNVKTRKTSMGGWSQARYQRHIENLHLRHMKEVVEVLERVVREEGIERIVVSCDDTARPLLMEELPKRLSEKLVDVIRLDAKAPEDQVLRETLEALRAEDARTDQEHVEAMLGAWRAGGLAVAGPEDTLAALQIGQVEELLIAATPAALRPPTRVPPGATPGPIDIETSAPSANVDAERFTLADDLITKAHATGARVRFIEEIGLLHDIGGVGAILRFKL